MTWPPGHTNAGYMPALYKEYNMKIKSSSCPFLGQRVWGHDPKSRPGMPAQLVISWVEQWANDEGPKIRSLLGGAPLSNRVYTYPRSAVKGARSWIAHQKTQVSGNERRRLARLDERLRDYSGPVELDLKHDLDDIPHNPSEYRLRQPMWCVIGPRTTSPLQYHYPPEKHEWFILRANVASLLLRETLEGWITEPGLDSQFLYSIPQEDMLPSYDAAVKRMTEMRCAGNSGWIIQPPADVPVITYGCLRAQLCDDLKIWGSHLPI